MEPLPKRNTDYDSIFNMPESSEASGKVTRKVSKRIKNVIKSWNTAIKAIEENKKQKYKIIGNKLNFITLTLPAQQKHTDREIKRQALRQFLQQLTRKHDLRRWFWKAEKQENGNIHFHIICDTFINWRDIRNEWNSQLERLGYISDYAKRWKEKDREGFKLHKEFGKNMNRKEQKKAYDYRIKTNYRDPNTTDIHATRKVRNIEAYMCKYVAKNEPEKKIDGKVWDCNQVLKDLQNYVNQETLDIYELKKLMDKDKRFFKFEGDYFTSYSGPVFKLIQERFPNLLEDMQQWFLEQLQAQVDSIEQEFGKSPPANPPPAHQPSPAPGVLKSAQGLAI